MRIMLESYNFFTNYFFNVTIFLFYNAVNSLVNGFIYMPLMLPTLCVFFVLISFMDRWRRLILKYPCVKKNVVFHISQLHTRKVTTSFTQIDDKHFSGK